VDADVLSVISKSPLRALPADTLDELTTGAVRKTISAGSLTHLEGEDTPHLELVLGGAVRVYVTAPDGRTMTIRYCRPGALIGVMSLFSSAFAMPATTQALVDAELLMMSPTLVRRMAERDVRVARAFLDELSERARSFVYEIPGSAFTTMRQRVARHLLDLASESGQQHSSGPESAQELTVLVSQQQLADSVGTVREVVVRVLRELRRDGVVRTERDGIVIIDPDRLIQEQGWNSSS
jgi:CRP/FNR family transcriptional regulator, cyclic AMP receptor protein